MKMRIFDEMLECPNMTIVKLKAGDRFLTGTQILAQKESKRVGDTITYYLVTSADSDGKNVSYKPVYAKLEE